MKTKQLVLLLSLMAAPASAHAADVEVDEAGEQPGSLPFAGTGVTFRTEATTLSFSPDAEPTYNPYLAMTTELAAAWHFTDTLVASGSFGFSRELTHSDSTTFANETVPSDTMLAIGSTKLFRIRLVDIDVGAGLGFQLPTSPSSQARTLLVGLTPNVSARRSFDLLSGISVGYRYRLTRYLHKYTTSELETPLITSCVSEGGGCEPFLNTGYRNTAWRQVHSVSANVGLVDTLALSAGTAWYVDSIYPGATDERVSFVPQEPTDTRHSIAYTAALSWAPMPSMTLSLGATTANAQLAPDSTHRTPFVNRNTTLFMDLGLDVAGLVAQLRD